MGQEQITRAACITVEPSGGAKLVDAPLKESELKILRNLVERYGYEAVADNIGGFKHIRINDPEHRGHHRDYAVEWRSP